MAHGLAVVVDKPFVVTSAQGEELSPGRRGRRAAQIFQNRRWDADFLTVRKLLRDGELGAVRISSPAEWWRPEGVGSWRDTATLAECAGILHDLGAHLIDQAIPLFGPVADRCVETPTSSRRPDGTDTESFVALLHGPGCGRSCG